MQGSHIVVLEPPRGTATEASALVSALAAIAGGGTLEILHSFEACIDRCRRSAVDLVVVDEGSERHSEEAVARLRQSGPPTIVVQRGASDGGALAWYRRGASDCVVAERDYGALRHAVRQQIERLRALRGAAGSDAPDVEGQEWRAQVLQTEKMASIGQLAAGVAHEINNPMGFIHANLFQMSEYVVELRQVWARGEALQKALASGESEALERAAEELMGAAQEVDVSYLLSDLAKAIRESQEGSERIRHIVQDLRDFSHHDTGERVLADLNQCLDSTANIVWPMMKHLVVLKKHYRELPPVPCYPMQLKQVFMNLLVNAYQAIEALPGSRAGTGTITLVTEPHTDGVQVEVRDTGVGIAPENLDRIFDPFFTTKKVGAGTGLGLSTSFNIIKRHGGTLSAESDPARGTIFRIRLPLLDEVLGGGEPA